MDTRLLHVLCARVASIADADAALIAMRRSCPRASRRSVLLFCDLAPQEHAVTVDDEPLIRRLQSGVMTANARSEASFDLLIRARAWSDAARQYLGGDQHTPAWRVIADLITDGRTQTALRAATCAPASLKGRYDAVLFSYADQLLTPDMPAQMLDALEHSGAACLRAQVCYSNVYPEPLLTRLLRSGFSLDPRQGDAPLPPVIVRSDALGRLDKLLLTAPLCACRAVLRDQPALPDLFASLRMRILREETQKPLLSAGQILLLFACALAGAPLPAILVLLLPEAHACLHPSRLPAALVRLSLLPLTACVSLDAWLCVRFAHARRFRLRVPDALLRPSGCAGIGALLILAALRGAEALPVLLIPGLLWLAAPLTERTLLTPVSQRIPIGEEERAQLLCLAKDAYAASSAIEPEDCPLGMLAACGAMLLDLLEPDEAARQIQSMLPALTDDALTPPAHQAALLVCAQCLRERMGQCDAALRALPGEIERRVLKKGSPPCAGLLGAWLACAHSQSRSAFAPVNQEAAPVDLLFLPLGPARSAPRHALSLPTTHPHTFLRRHASGAIAADAARIETFLFLCDAALGHPFYALLARSPIAGPYAALLMI